MDNPTGILAVAFLVAVVLLCVVSLVACIGDLLRAPSVEATYRSVISQ
jgi:hypothetical protein